MVILVCPFGFHCRNFYGHRFKPEFELLILFRFAALKEPIRKEVQKQAASDYTNKNLIGGFRTAQDIIDYHCKSVNGKMHPKFIADPSKTDGKGFYLLDRWPEKIGLLHDSSPGWFLTILITY